MPSVLTRTPSRLGAVPMSAARKLCRRLPDDADPLIAKAAVAMAAGTIRPGTLTHALIYHDDWCDQLHGRGPCNCEPDIRLVPDQPSMN